MMAEHAKTCASQNSARWVKGIWKISRRGATARVWKLSHWVMWKFGCGMYCIISIQKLPHSWHVFNNREYVGGCGGYGVAVSTRQQVVRELLGYAVGRSYAVGGIIVGSKFEFVCLFFGRIVGLKKSLRLCLTFRALGVILKHLKITLNLHNLFD